MEPFFLPRQLLWLSFYINKPSHLCYLYTHPGLSYIVLTFTIAERGYLDIQLFNFQDPVMLVEESLLHFVRFLSVHTAAQQSLYRTLQLHLSNVCSNCLHSCMLKHLTLWASWLQLRGHDYAESHAAHRCHIQLQLHVEQSMTPEKFFCCTNQCGACSHSPQLDTFIYLLDR